tara:strand:+ start:1344 stop:1730 length:387 start_codon:yes stop_codon:yes gene_type:complete
MSVKNLTVRLLGELVVEIESLSESDLEKIEAGDYSISLKITKKKNTKEDVELTEEQISNLLSELKSCADRESGIKLLIEQLKNKKQLEAFARGVDIYFMRQDKVDKIRERIVEGIIGASLRSSAIQGA